MQKAFAAMDALEAGAIANPDEKRMVGHYWLRDPTLAPTPELARGDRRRRWRASSSSPTTCTTARVRGERGALHEPARHRHRRLGARSRVRRAPRSARPSDRMQRRTSSTTPIPTAWTACSAQLGGGLDETLTSSSRSRAAPRRRATACSRPRPRTSAPGLDFGKHAVAVTGVGSELDATPTEKGWLARFPMWDWVGGRTQRALARSGSCRRRCRASTSTRMLDGARGLRRGRRACTTTRKNPAALLALCWYSRGRRRGEKDMVVLPYKDRLVLFSRYLQQLVMESLGKEKDLDGKVVHQGIAVYGNKGSTDQHAYVQQLREGVHNFFVTFIEVLQGSRRQVAGGRGRARPRATTSPASSTARGARSTRTIASRSPSPSTRSTRARVGVLIALYERAVGFYASLVNINAYHQPGVEAGKKAAAAVLALQTEDPDAARRRARASATVDEIARGDRRQRRHRARLQDPRARRGQSRPRHHAHRRRIRRSPRRTGGA